MYWFSHWRICFCMSVWTHHLIHSEAVQDGAPSHSDHCRQQLEPSPLSPYGSGCCSQGSELWVEAAFQLWLLHSDSSCHPGSDQCYTGPAASRWGILDGLGFPASPLSSQWACWTEVSTVSVEVAFQPSQLHSDSPHPFGSDECPTEPAHPNWGILDVQDLRTDPSGSQSGCPTTA